VAALTQLSTILGPGLVQRLTYATLGGRSTGSWLQVGCQTRLHSREVDSPETILYEGIVRIGVWIDTRQRCAARQVFEHEYWEMLT